MECDASQISPPTVFQARGQTSQRQSWSKMLSLIEQQPTFQASPSTQTSSYSAVLCKFGGVLDRWTVKRCQWKAADIYTYTIYTKINVIHSYWICLFKKHTLQNCVTKRLEYLFYLVHLIQISWVNCCSSWHWFYPVEGFCASDERLSNFVGCCESLDTSSWMTTWRFPEEWFSEGRDHLITSNRCGFHWELSANSPCRSTATWSTTLRGWLGRNHTQPISG